jgi:hypothetical protein
MKRTLVITILTMSLILTGCSTPVEQEDTADGPVNITIVETNGSGVWYMIANGISESLNQLYDGSVVNIIPGDTVSNAALVNGEQADFGFVHNTIAYQAYNGTGEFDEKLEHLRSVNTFYTSLGQFFLLDSFGVHTMEDFFEKKPAVRISISTSATAKDFENLLSVYGYTLDDLIAWGCQIDNRAIADATSMLADGALDGYYSTIGPGNSHIVANTANKAMTLVEADVEHVEKMAAKYGYVLDTIPKGAYNFLDHDVISYGVFTMLITSDHVSDDVVYKTLKSMHENLDYMKSVHNLIKDLSPESMIQNVAIPLHPGAERFYKELGLME